MPRRIEAHIPEWGDTACRLDGTNGRPVEPSRHFVSPDFDGAEAKAQSVAESGGMISYPEEQEREITGFCTAELLNHIPESLLFPCAVAA